MEASLSAGVLPMLLFIATFLRFINSLCFAQSTIHLGNETDRIALLAFKEKIINDPNGVLSSWNNSLHFCMWSGVTCSRRHPQRVQTLNLIEQSLWGSLSPHIGNLSFLRNINLSGNNLEGCIPQEIGQLFRIRELWLVNNSFVGEIPNNLTHCLQLRTIYVYGNKLDGKIPMAIGSLTNLIALSLRSNKLSGHIPPSLGNLSSLVLLDLVSNSLDGSIPQELGQLVKLQHLQIDGNKFLVVRPKKPREKLLSTLSMGENFLRVTYAELFRATSGFSSANLIGMGSYGSVYRGIIDRMEMIVAIKVLKLQQQRASKSFIAECRALRSIRHRNIVKVFTVCSSIDFGGNDFKALVLEYMPNGSLDGWLHPSADELHPLKILNLIQRLNIALDIASALDYLHNHCRPPIVHCDLKPSNILLDDDMVAHVSDFGLSTITSEGINYSQCETNSLVPMGSIGYIAPEYGTGANPSTYGDVYSYGILLLEMVTGKRPSDDMFKDDLDLLQFAKMALPESVMDIVDRRLLSEEIEIIRHNRNCNRVNSMMHECLVSLVKIGVSCSVESPRARKEMKDVIAELQKVRDFYLAATVVRNA